MSNSFKMPLFFKVVFAFVAVWVLAVFVSLFVVIYSAVINPDRVASGLGELAGSAAKSFEETAR